MNLSSYPMSAEFAVPGGARPGEASGPAPTRSVTRRLLPWLVLSVCAHALALLSMHAVGGLHRALASGAVGPSAINVRLGASGRTTPAPVGPRHAAAPAHAPVPVPRAARHPPRAPAPPPPAPRESAVHAVKPALPKPARSIELLTSVHGKHPAPRVAAHHEMRAPRRPRHHTSRVHRRELPRRTHTAVNRHHLAARAMPRKRRRSAPQVKAPTRPKAHTARRSRAEPAPPVTAARARPGVTPTGASAPRGAARSSPPGGARRAGATTRAGRDGGFARLVAALHLAIAHHQRYPLLARRMGLEGAATVGFELHPDGRVTDLRLIEPSGVASLDRAALRAVAAVAPFTPARSALRAPRRFRVRVVFRLE